MNEDLLELLDSLKSRRVEFLVIGAHAVSFYARPRMTEDLDLWIGPDRQNADRFRQAMDDFGAPIGEEGARRFSELNRQMLRIGVPPNMVDILNWGGTQPFEKVYKQKISGALNGVDLFFPSIDDLINMKLEAGRPQDLADVASLRRIKKQKT